MSVSENNSKTVLILGANSDVAKQCIKHYVKKGYDVIAASRNITELDDFVQKNRLKRVTILHFDAIAYSTHQFFYDKLPKKPNIVLYAAGFLKDNLLALRDFNSCLQMMTVHYSGAVSILNIIAMDDNPALERIIGLSSLSGVRGRKSNFIYGSSKAAFTQYLAGLRQFLSSKVVVNVIVAGYIDSKMTQDLKLPKQLLLTPEYIAESVVNIGSKFITVPSFRWKLIYYILKLSPEWLVAKLP